MSVALITGASRRIGAAITSHLAEVGHKVIIHSRHPDDADAAGLRENIIAGGGDAYHIAGDLAEQRVMTDLLDHAVSTVGEPIGLLVNNASVFEEDSLECVSFESWDLHQRINLLAPLMLSKAFAAQLPRDAEGLIVNITDQRVWRLNPTFLSYTASKAGLWTLTQTLAQTLAPRIRVNAIGPGPVFESIHQTSESFQAEAARVPLQKGPDAKEIAAAVSFLLESPSITGQMLAIDGGQHLAWQTPDVST